MSAIFSWEQIDRDLEKQVFLIEADEGNYGLYSLIWELGYYKGLPVDQKYAFASQLLKELVVDGLLVIEEFENPDFKNKLRTIGLNELDSVLNDVTAWYPHRTP